MKDYFDGYFEVEIKRLLNKWVCIYCEEEVDIKYIATGHDHTDYSYRMCNCLGAKQNGVPNKDCN